MKRSFIREILENTTDKTISFAGGLPNIDTFPQSLIEEVANKILQNREVLQYSNSWGDNDLREEIAKRYTKNGFKTKANNILITSGSQQALDIVCRYYANSSIIIEKPSYLGALNLFKLNKITTNPIKLLNNGIDIKALKKVITKDKLLYLIPDFQNPTATRYSLKKRKKIAKLIKENSAILIEDSPYSELYFNKAIPSISSFAPKNSILLGSFSKVLAPSLRVGYIRADKKILESLIAYKEAMDLHTSTITQKIVAELLKQELKYNKNLQKTREYYQKKCNYFSKVLDKELPQFNYQKPKGGMFIYGKISGINSTKLLEKTMQKGVVFVPGSEFGGEIDEVRFNFTNSTKKDIKKGIKVIASLLK